mmetsp:Transcript_3032/g.7415  ORF Transcript_3032/g.7415 Transcript_3032/m.7415 type:complete len:229 (-) Transcript_3032:552-1238(-)
MHRAPRWRRCWRRGLGWAGAAQPRGGNVGRSGGAWSAQARRSLYSCRGTAPDAPSAAQRGDRGTRGARAWGLLCFRFGVVGGHRYRHICRGHGFVCSAARSRCASGSRRWGRGRSAFVRRTAGCVPPDRDTSSAGRDGGFESAHGANARMDGGHGGRGAAAGGSSTRRVAVGECSAAAAAANAGGLEPFPAYGSCGGRLSSTASRSAASSAAAAASTGGSPAPVLSSG